MNQQELPAKLFKVLRVKLNKWPKRSMRKSRRRRSKNSSLAIPALGNIPTMSARRHSKESVQLVEGITINPRSAGRKHICIVKPVTPLALMQPGSASELKGNWENHLQNLVQILLITPGITAQRGREATMSPILLWPGTLVAHQSPLQRSTW